VTGLGPVYSLEEGIGCGGLTGSLEPRFARGLKDNRWRILLAILEGFGRKILGGANYPAKGRDRSNWA